MCELPYLTIPNPPEEVTATAVLARLVDGLGFRYRWATEGLREEDYDYQPSPDSMTMKQLLEHIHGLVSWTLQSLSGNSQSTAKTPTLQEIRSLTLDKIERISAHLVIMNPDKLASLRISTRSGEHPFWNMVNGPLSDALTHVGQINSWRRLNGNPVPRHSVFLGKPLF